MAQLIDISKNENIDIAIQTIKDGGLVVFPTETVYGIGANALDSKAVDKVFQAKGRPNDNPLIVHISNMNMLDNLIKGINDIERTLIEHFWPGPLTIVFEKKDIIPNNVSGNLNTVGIRMPDNMVTLEIIDKAGLPIVGPSANISGRPSGTSIKDIYEELNDKVDVIVDNGNTEIGIESTVIKVEKNKVIILRPGIITPDNIQELGIEVELSEHIFNIPNAKEKILSPGMKYKHYAPATESILIYSNDNNKTIATINKLLTNHKNVVLLLSNQNIERFSSVTTMDLGRDGYEIARNIFSLLRKADELKPDLIIIEGVKKDGIGIAIMNRLIRACSHNYIEIE